MTKEIKPGPVDTLRDGFLKATIWSNEGENGSYFTIDFAKTYEKDGELHDGRSFTSQDLLAVAELARRAYRQVRAHQNTQARMRNEPEV